MALQTPPLVGIISRDSRTREPGRVGNAINRSNGQNGQGSGPTLLLKPCGLLLYSKVLDKRLRALEYYYIDEVLVTALSYIQSKRQRTSMLAAMSWLNS